MPSIQPKSDTEPPSVRYGTEPRARARCMRSANCSASPPATRTGVSFPRMLRGATSHTMASASAPR